MRKLMALVIFLGFVSMAFAGTREVPSVTSGSASSTFGVGAPHFSKAPVSRPGSAVTPTRKETTIENIKKNMNKSAKKQ